MLCFAGMALEAARGINIGNDWDGGDMQDAMTECGLLAPVVVTQPCDSHPCSCADYGDFPATCCRYTALARAALQSLPSPADTP